MPQMLPVLTQFFPPKAKWTQADVPDQTGRVVIVTGGNNGIGKETVRTLLERNAKVYMASRSKSRAETAIAELKQDTGKEAIFLELDLSSLESVRKAADEFMSKEPALHVLYNNAGIMSPPIDETVNGLDLQFATNVLGHYFFTELLLPSLRAGIESSPDHKARVVNVASSGSYLGSLEDFKRFKDTPERRQITPEYLYYQSKMANAVYSAEFAKRHADEGIVTTALNPGCLKTDILKTAGLILRIISPIIMFPVPMGAITSLWAGTALETLDYNGQFLIPWARLGKGPTEVEDLELRKRLYSWLEEQVVGH